ncbi:MAG: hypothetical protein Q8P83_01520 [bacterium]|nr:hypothetical protein [bacterium]
MRVRFSPAAPDERKYVVTGAGRIRLPPTLKLRRTGKIVRPYGHESSPPAGRAGILSRGTTCKGFITLTLSRRRRRMKRDWRNSLRRTRDGSDLRDTLAELEEVGKPGTVRHALANNRTERRSMPVKRDMGRRLFSGNLPQRR